MANKKTNQQIAYEVIDGKWGNGSARKNALTKAGYNYMAVQSIVNSIMSGKYTPTPEAPDVIEISGTEVMEIEIDLTKFNGLNITFKYGGEDNAESNTEC